MIYMVDEDIQCSYHRLSEKPQDVDTLEITGVISYIEDIAFFLYVSFSI